MNFRNALLKLLSSAKGVDTSNLTEKQQYSVELLEKRIMFSATQAGAALGDGGIDFDQVENLASDGGIQELFGNLDQNIDQGEIENFVSNLIDEYEVGSDGNDRVSGGAGNDQVRGAAGNDVLAGNAGNDALYGNDGRDTIEGGDGNDRLVGGAGDDILDGGRGHDTAYFNNSFDGYSFERPCLRPCGRSAGRTG